MHNTLGAATRCLLIQPQISEHCSLNYTEVCQLVGAKYPTPPLGLLTVAALLPATWQLKLVDANIEPLTDAHFEWADLVCSGGIISQQLEILAIIDRAHAFGKKVVLGGPEPSSQPQLYGDADYLVIGEGENTIPLLLQDLARGVAKGIYRAAERPDLCSAVVPRYDLIHLGDYVMMGIQSSRGCPFNCEFCDVIEIFGRQARTKSAPQILAELQNLYQLGYRGRVFFVDDNFFGNRSKARELVIAIAGWMRAHHAPFYFAAETSMNLADDEPLLQLARDAGFRYLSTGIETPENEILLQIEKKQNTNRPVAETIERFYAGGMAVDTSLILGFDGESRDTADNMIRCLEESGIAMAMIGTLYALPNTRLAKRLKQEGRLWHDTVVQRDRTADIDQMTSGLNFETSRPRQEILQDYIRVLETIYAPQKYFGRLLLAGLQLRRQGAYHPGLMLQLKLVISFLRVCWRVGLNRRTGRLYWHTLAKVLVRNPRALEVVVSYAAMYLHLDRHAQFIVGLTRQKLASMALDSAPPGRC